MGNKYKHTPGPWRSYKSTMRKHLQARFIGYGDMKYIGKVYGHDGQPVDANAQLVAAAPDMFVALLCEPCTSGACEQARELYAAGRIARQDYRESLCFRCAAIIKATGDEIQKPEPDDRLRCQTCGATMAESEYDHTRGGCAYCEAN